ncbi:MAG: hypothetical protein Q9221_008147 [Calogaya cf. arnoldii]
MEFTTLARSNQILQAMKILASTSGIISGVYTHALRTGTSRHHVLTILASTLLTLTVTAAPSTAVAPKHDPCGPIIQIPGDPANTCNEAPVPIGADASPGAYSITPIPQRFPEGYNSATCDPVINELCKIMSSADVTLGRWYFQTNDAQTHECQMGFYLPAIEGAALRPKTVGEDPENGNQCKKILGAIAKAAEVPFPLTTYINSNFQAQTVNLVKRPINMEGMWPSIEGIQEPFDGQAVNAGYPSYLWQMQAIKQPATDSSGKACGPLSDDDECGF